MKGNFNFFKNTFDQKIYENMVNAEEYQDLWSCLIRMQAERGIAQEVAQQTADDCIKAMIFCESVREKVAGDVSGVLDTLLEEISADEDGEIRELNLLRLLFGLTVHQNADMAEKLRSGISLEGLFMGEYYDKNKGVLSTEQLKQEIRNAAVQYTLSADVLNAFVKQIQSSGDYLATAAALGEGDINFKCILAMETYLENRGDITMEEAANQACYSVQMQAVADTVGKGMITRSMAKKIAIVAGITVVIVAVGVAIYYAGSGAALATVAAGAQDFVVAVPEVFAEFSNAVTAAGEPGIVAVTAQMLRDGLQPKIDAAKTWKLVSIAIAAGGAAMAALSKKTADLIGKFRVGFSEEKKYVVSGMQSVAAEVEAEHAEEAEMPAFEYVPVYQETEERQQVPVFG